MKPLRCTICRTRIFPTPEDFVEHFKTTHMDDRTARLFVAFAERLDEEARSRGGHL